MSRWLDAARKARGSNPAPVSPVLSEKSVLSAGEMDRARLPDPPPNPSDGLSERVAIMVHDGGLPVDWAEAFAAYQAMPPPEGLTAAQWLALIDKGLTMGDVQATRLAGLGWAFRDLFRTDGPWPRLDLQGRGWLLAEALAVGGAVVAMDEAAIRYQDRAGACFTIWKPGREPWQDRAAGFRSEVA